MITMREARLRLAVNNMRIVCRDGEYRVSYAELMGGDRDEASAYYTDDLEDAVLTGAAMRRRFALAA